MQVTETLSDGLRREFKVVVPAAELDTRLTTKLEEMKGQAQIRGFRPGKVPLSHMRRMFGRQTMSQIVNDILNENAQKTLSERGERAAMQPSFDLPEDQEEAGRILDAKADLAFSMKYEVLPKVTLGDFAALKVERPITEIGEADVDAEVRKLADSARSYTVRDGAAESGDRVTIDYVGKLDGVPFEGGSDTNAGIVIGSKQFIPGFEEQLTGVNAGDTRILDITFPDGYAAAHLAGKPATFDVTVREVASPDPIAVDDTLAARFGVESLAKLRETLRAQVEAQYAPFTRQKVKRQLLDQLDSQYGFDLPPTMVTQEFENIWRQVTEDMTKAARSFADEETTEEAAREYYQKIANRRVRLGLVLAEIGEQNKVDVSEAELQRALSGEMRRYPGQEQQILQYYRSNPGALSALRAPVFEEKVIDHLLSIADVTDKVVSKDELTRYDEDTDLPKAPPIGGAA